MKHKKNRKNNIADKCNTIWHSYIWQLYNLFRFSYQSLYKSTLIVFVRMSFFSMLVIFSCAGCAKKEEEEFFSSVEQERISESDKMTNSELKSEAEPESEVESESEGSEPLEELERSNNSAYAKDHDDIKDSADAKDTGDSKGSENTEEAKAQEDISELDDAVIPEVIYVDVCGAVNQPGVYRLEASARVFEAIELAGGYTTEAALSYINRANVLKDGQQIYVPTQAEVEAQNWQILLADNSAEDVHRGSDLDRADSDFGNTGSDSEITNNAANQTEDDSRININTASTEELSSLPGIGEAKALAIIAYREENGGFSSVDEITNVPGIKEGTYNKFKDGITIE